MACDYRRDIVHVADAFGIEELLDPKYDDYLFGRARHIDEIEALVRAAALTAPAEEVYHKAQAAHLPRAYVNAPEDLLRSQQFRARGFWTAIDHPVAGTLTYATAPARMSDSAWRSERAPLLGEHNREILGHRLGLSDAEITQLRAAGVA